MSFFVRIYSYVREEINNPILTEVGHILQNTLQLRILVEIPLSEEYGA